MYSDGYGVLKNLQMAHDWYFNAAKQGHASSKYNLGTICYNAERVEKNFESAYYWFELAARQGVVIAQFILGEMFLDGIG